MWPCPLGHSTAVPAGLCACTSCPSTAKGITAWDYSIVVVAQEQRPLAVGGNVRSLPENVGDGEAVFLSDRHVDPRHQRKVIDHVTLVAVAEIGNEVFRQLMRLGEQHFGRYARIERVPA